MYPKPLLCIASTLYGVLSTDRSPGSEVQDWSSSQSRGKYKQSDCRLRCYTDGCLYFHSERKEVNDLFCSYASLKSFLCNSIGDFLEAQLNRENLCNN